MTGWGVFPEFIFSDGSKAIYKHNRSEAESEFKEYRIKPDGAKIKYIILRYAKMNTDREVNKRILAAIECFD